MSRRSTSSQSKKDSAEVKIRLPAHNAGATNKPDDGCEINNKGCKVLQCKQKGHLAKTCLDSKKPHCQVGLEVFVVENTEEGDEQDPTTDKTEEPNPWLLTITTGGKDNDGTTTTRGLT